MVQDRRSPDRWRDRLIVSRVASLARRIELRTERESLLQVLDEDAYFGGQPATGRPNRKDRHRSFKGSQKAYNSTFSEFCGEEPCWRLGNPQMFKDTHPHLFNIAGSKDACGDNARTVWRNVAWLAKRVQGLSSEERP